MEYLVTVIALVQLLPTGMIAQSTVTDLSSSVSQDLAPSLTLGIATLTPTPALSSDVVVANVAASSHISNVDSASKIINTSDQLQSSFSSPTDVQQTIFVNTAFATTASPSTILASSALDNNLNIGASASTEVASTIQMVSSQATDSGAIVSDVVQTVVDVFGSTVVVHSVASSSDSAASSGAAPSGTVDVHLTPSASGSVYMDGSVSNVEPIQSSSNLILPTNSLNVDIVSSYSTSGIIDSVQINPTQITNSVFQSNVLEAVSGGIDSSSQMQDSFASIVSSSQSFIHQTIAATPASKYTAVLITPTILLSISMESAYDKTSELSSSVSPLRTVSVPVLSDVAQSLYASISTSMQGTNIVAHSATVVPSATPATDADGAFKSIHTTNSAILMPSVSDFASGSDESVNDGIITLPIQTVNFTRIQTQSASVAITMTTTPPLSAVQPTQSLHFSSKIVYHTPSAIGSSSMPSMPFPSAILPTRPSDLVSSVLASISSSSNVSILRPGTTPSVATPSVMPTISALPSNFSDFLSNMSTSSEFIMKMTSVNYSSMESSVFSASRSFSLPLPYINITGPSSSVFSSFVQLTTIHMSTPTLVSQAPYITQSVINHTSSVMILTPTVLLPTSSNMTTVLRNVSMALTSAYSMSRTVFPSTAFIATPSVFPSAILPSSATSQVPTSIHQTAAPSSSSALHIPIPSPTSVRPTRTIHPSPLESQLQPSLTVPHSIMTSPSPGMTSSDLMMSASTHIIPTPSTSVMLTLSTTAVLPNSTLIVETTSGSVPLPSPTSPIPHSSVVLDTSVVITPSLATSIHLMSTSMIAPTSSEVTPTLSSEAVPTTTVLETTPSLNFTMSTSIPTTSSAVENVTSVNVTNSVIMTSTAEVMSTSVMPPTTTPAPTTTTTVTTEPPTTTTTPPPTTTSNEQVTYWMITVVKVPVSVNISGDTFINKMELGLAVLFNEAYTRKKETDTPSFDSRRRRKRRRRAATVGDVVVDMKTTSRDSTDPTAVSLAYTVEKAGTLVPSAAASETIDLVSDQEMAIELRYIVTQKANPFNWVATTTVAVPVAPTVITESFPVWMIGVIIGGVVILILIAVIGLCIALKKKKKSGADEEAEPRLMNLKNSPLYEDDDDERSSRRVKTNYSSNMSDKGSSSNLKVQSPKKQSYEVNNYEHSKEEDTHVYAEVKKPKKPDLASRVRKGYSSSQEGLEAETMADDAGLLDSPTKKGDRGKRKKKKKDGDQHEIVDVMTKSVYPTSLTVPPSENAYYSAEEEDEMKQRKAAERKKNKQRIREKKKREEVNTDQLMVDYLAAQEEIDSVLDAPIDNGEIPDVFIHKKKKSRKMLEGHDNMALTAEETLHVARNRMHDLLDDAFSLMSPSGTNIGPAQPPEDEGNLNKVYPGNDRLAIGHDIFLARTTSPSTDSSESIFVPEDTSSLGSYDVRATSAKKHTPMKMESYKGEPVLQTWSPYRAADQVALISLPNKMQTNIGRVPSARGRRPAANLLDKKPKADVMPTPAFLKSRDIISTKGSQSDLISQNGNLASRTGKGKSKANESSEEPEEETTEFLQPVEQFEDIEISKENSMLPSIRARKMAKAAKKRMKNGGVGMEMKSLNGKVGQKHKEPFKTVPDGADEIDIITRSVQSAVTTDNAIQSIRNEIKSSIPDKNVVTKFGGSRRNSQASGSLVDIA